MDPKMVPADTQLRLAGEVDCALLAEIAAAATPHSWSENQYRDSVHAGHQCWLLESAAGEGIACCVIGQLFDEAEILDVAVVPTWRRRGIARWLLREVFTRLPADIHRVLLDVRVSNEAARELYRSLGFSEDGVRRNYYPTTGGCREDAVLMSLVR